MRALQEPGGEVWRPSTRLSRRAQAIRDFPSKLTVVRSQLLLKDLRWLGRKHERLLLKEALRRLEQDPLASTRNMKDLRPNPVAQRELRLLGQYRLFFNVDPVDNAVTLVRAGRKRGAQLFMRGETARLSCPLA